MKKDLNGFDILVLVLVSAAAVFTIVASVASLFMYPELSTSPNDGIIYDYSAGWKDSSGITMSVNGMIGRPGALSSTEPLIVSRSLGSVNRGDMLYIYSRDLVINIYADEQILHYTAENGLAGGENGFDNYILVSVPSYSEAKQLELHIYSASDSDNPGIGNMLVGSESAIIRRLFGENVIPVLSSVIFAVLGIALIIFGVSTRSKLDGYMSSVYFGIFLLLLAFGSVFDTSWAHIVLNNIIYVETSQRIFLSAALPAFLAFIDSFFVTEHVYPIKVLSVLSVVTFAVQLVLNLTQTLTYSAAGTYYLIFIAVCGLVTFEELFVFMIKTRGTKALRSQRDYISVFIFIGCCIIDIIVFLRISAGNDDLFFTRLGLYVMTAVTLFSWFSEILNMIKLGVQAGRIGKIAFTDANTGIGNVAAFKSEFDELETKKFGYKYIGIVQFDVNNLKVINDSRGHEAGDLLIKSAADIINKSFGAVGNCYRTGGDEFVALVTSDHAPIVCEEAIYNFNKLIDKFNNDPDKPFDLRIAYGIAYYQNDKTANKTLKEIHKIADERMYDNKKMLKARYARTPEEAVIR